MNSRQTPLRHYGLGLEFVCARWYSNTTSPVAGSPSSLNHRTISTARLTSGSFALWHTYTSSASFFTRNVDFACIVLHIMYNCHHTSRTDQRSVMEKEMTTSARPIYIKSVTRHETTKFYVGYEPSRPDAHVCSRLGSYFICVDSLSAAKAIAAGVSTNVIECPPYTA